MRCYHISTKDCKSGLSFEGADLILEIGNNKLRGNYSLPFIFDMVEEALLECDEETLKMPGIKRRQEQMIAGRKWLAEHERQMLQKEEE